jgi:dihydrofolate synthase / folylpolyglutamate synthase
LITLPQHPDANRVLGEVAEKLSVRAVSAVEHMPGLDAGAAGRCRVEALGTQIEVDSPLAGAHQHRNRALAIAAAVELKERHGFPVTPASLEAGIRDTVWPGRLERLSARGAEWILDVAHNPAGAWALRAALSATVGGATQRVLVFSCLRDKAIDEMAQILFPVFEYVILAPIHSSRAAAMDDLMAAARLTGTPAIAAETVEEALRLAREASRGEPVVISGSLFLVGEARSLLSEEGARET